MFETKCAVETISSSAPALQLASRLSTVQTNLNIMYQQDQDKGTETISIFHSTSIASLAHLWTATKSVGTLFGIIGVYHLGNQDVLTFNLSPLKSMYNQCLKKYHPIVFHCTWLQTVESTFDFSKPLTCTSLSGRDFAGARIRNARLGSICQDQQWSLIRQG